MDRIQLDQPIGSRPKEDVVQLLQWLVFLRVVVSTFILVTTLLIQLPATLTFLYLLVSVNVLFNLLAAFLVPRVKSLTAPTNFLIYWDVIFVTLLVYISGGIESPFSFMYILSLIYAGLLLSTHGAMLTSVVCVMAYGSVMLLQYSQLLPAFIYNLTHALPAPIQPREIFFKVLINGIAFFIAAFLSNLIAEQLRRTGAQLAEKQDDLQALRTLNENMVRSVMIGLITVDRNLQITFANPTAERILAQPFNSLRNRPFHELFQEVSESLQSISPPESPPKRHECAWQRDDGETLYLGFSLSRLKDQSEETIGWIVSFQDMTELRRMEKDVKRADRLATVGKLAAGIAHEIRNPLASISGSIQVLSSELDLDRVNGSLMEIVLRETDRLNRLISDFLDFARPARMKPEVVDLNLLLDETVEMVRHSEVSSEGIEFRKRYDANVFIQADSDQLRQLFLNLMLNGVQAMKNGGAIELTTRRLLQEEGREEEEVQVDVSDSGSGMPEEVQESMFDPFFTTKESGTGLGLTVAYRIVENHRGRISLSSQPGGGTCFTILMPVGHEQPVDTSADREERMPG